MITIFVCTVCHVDGDARHRTHRRGEPGCLLVVLRETVDVVVQRVQSRGSQNASLPHATAEDLPEMPRLVDELFGPGDDGSHRRTQTFRKTDRDGIHVAAIV